MKKSQYHILVGLIILTWLVILGVFCILLFKSYNYGYEQYLRELAVNDSSQKTMHLKLDSIQPDVLLFSSVHPQKLKANGAEEILSDIDMSQNPTLDSIGQRLNSRLQSIIGSDMAYALILDQTANTSSSQDSQTSSLIKNKILGNLKTIDGAEQTHTFQSYDKKNRYKTYLYTTRLSTQTITLRKIKNQISLASLALIALGFFLLYVIKFIRKLEKENHEQHEFIENIRKSLQAPLTTIKETSATQMGALAEGKMEDARRMGSYIHAQTARLQQIVNQINDNINVDLTQVLSLRQIDLQKLFDHCIEDMKIKYPDRPVNISVALNPQDLEMVCDPLYFKTAILNILDNAFHYNEENLDLFVEIGANRVHDFTLITISDNGGGVDHNELTNLTQKYYRAPQHQYIDGLGLGLYQVKEIIQAHGGRVKFTGDTTAGLSVELKIPILEHLEEQAS